MKKLFFFLILIGFCAFFYFFSTRDVNYEKINKMINLVFKETKKEYKNDIKVINNTNHMSTNEIKKQNEAIQLLNLPSFDFISTYSKEQTMNKLDELDKIVDVFVKKYRGRIAKLKVKEFYEAISEYEKILESQYKIVTIPNLIKDTDLSNDLMRKLCSTLDIRSTEIFAKLTFFEIEIMKISNTLLEKFYKDGEKGWVIKYKPYITNVRKYSKYTLSEELEQMSIKKSVFSTDAWSKLYSNILSTMRFEIDKKEYNMSNISPLLYSTDKEIRNRVYNELGMFLKNNQMQITSVINSVIQDKRLEDKMRGYESPMARRNISNNVSDADVFLMISTIKANYQNTAQRYYKLKAKMLGIEKFQYSDRLAKIEFKNNIETPVIQWDQAKAIILDSYKSFSPRLYDLGNYIFLNNRIDAKSLPNKIAGAYCELGSPSFNPYILMSYNGTRRDVSTISHEVGHGIHAMLSYKNGFLMLFPGLTVAELASLFCEKLTFDSLLQKAKDVQEKIILISENIEERLSAITFATAVADFENKVHAMSINGNLSTDDINREWLIVLKEMYGNTVELNDLDSFRWMGIPHIFKSPFYYYAYAFSQLSVDALYDAYKTSKIANFNDKMIDLFSKGGTSNHKQLMLDVGLDMSNKNFWQNALNITIKMIDELDLLVNSNFNLFNIAVKNITVSKRNNENNVVDDEVAKKVK